MSAVFIQENQTDILQDCFFFVATSIWHQGLMTSVSDSLSVGNGGYLARSTTWNNIHY